LIKRVLIVNRGEIAVRVIKACKEMGITSIAIYSEADKNSLHVRMADESFYIGESAASESYLNIDKIIKLAIDKNIDALHPGYGFLSENHDFIKAVEDNGLIFIGPSSESVRMMGSKTEARKIMSKHRVPIVPGTVEPIKEVGQAIKIIEEIGLPVMIKASAGGGGKGMRKITSFNDFEQSFLSASNEAKKSFGNDEVYIEKFIEDPKHIEVQIIADSFGNYAHLFERECSVQRRHQKIIEEAPSSFIDEALRTKITESAVNAAKACNYLNAGTVEFLVDKDKNFYFLEMNTRLQVEHPVTEMITGIDLVKEQINIASGKKLSFSQEDIGINGHAVEARIYAEDADNNFSPSTGHIQHHRLPSGFGVRVDKGIDILSDISVYYDPMLSKVTAWDKTRDEAIKRLLRALDEYQISGVITNIPMCKWVLQNRSFNSGVFDINFIEKEFMPLVPLKWRSSEIDEYEKIVSIISALIKYQENKFSIKENIVTDCNKWNEENYE